MFSRAVDVDQGDISGEIKTASLELELSIATQDLKIDVTLFSICLISIPRTQHHKH